MPARRDLVLPIALLLIAIGPCCCSAAAPLTTWTDGFWSALRYDAADGLCNVLFGPSPRHVADRVLDWTCLGTQALIALSAIAIIARRVAEKRKMDALDRELSDSGGPEDPTGAG